MILVSAIAVPTTISGGADRAIADAGVPGGGDNGVTGSLFSSSCPPKRTWVRLRRNPVSRSMEDEDKEGAKAGADNEV